MAAGRLGLRMFTPISVVNVLWSSMSVVPGETLVLESKLGTMQTMGKHSSYQL